MSYNGLTNQGLEYLTRCQVESKPVVFSKVKIGNGNIPMGSTGETTTDLYSFKKEIEILNKEQVENSIKMEILINNFDVLEEFYVKEIGVYVMDNDVEKLYWYINKDRPSPLPDKNTPAKHRYILHLETSQMESIILNYTGLDLMVDKEFVEKKIKEKVRTFEISTIAELQSRKNLKVGDIVEVLGYYSAGDGAGHKRIIANEDDGSGVQLANGLWANILHNGEINIKWAGAKGDGKTDDTIAFQKVLSMKNNGHLIGGTLKIPVGIFIISETLNVGAINIVGQSNYSYDLKHNYGNSSVIRWNGAENSFMLKGEEDSVWSLKKLIFDGNSVNWKTDASITPDIATNKGRSQYSWTFTKNNVSGVDLWDAGNNVIDCCYFYNFSGLALSQSKSAGYIILSNLHFWYCNVALRLAFDTTASNLKFFNCVRGIEMTNGGANNLNNLRFDSIAEYPIYLTGTNRNIITNIVVDQINWAAICLDSHSRGNIITGDFTRSAKYYASIPIDKVKKEEIGRACAVYFTGENSSENHIICNIQKGPFDDRTEQTHYTPSIFVGYDGKWHQMNVIEIASQSLVLYNYNLYKNPQIISENLVYCQKNIKPEPIVSAPCDTIILNGENIKYSFINNQFRVIYNNRLLSSAENGVSVFNEIWLKENEGLEYWDGETIYKILKDETHEGWIKFVKIYEKPTPVQQLNSLHYVEKMKQENVYYDYITYMDEKTSYDKQQEKLEKDKQLAYEQALKKNPNLSYKEFMSVQPMTLNLMEEPQPSENLKRFMKKYL